MRFLLLLISLAIMCLVHAFPEEDKPLIFKIAEKTSYFMVYSMTSPSKIILDITQSILDNKKANQSVLDDLQDRLNEANKKEDYDYTAVQETNEEEKKKQIEKKPTPDYIMDFRHIFRIYKEPKDHEKRNRFNIWTNGQFDKIVGKYYEDIAEQKKSIIEAVKITVPKLSEPTRKSFKNLINKLNEAVGEQRIWDAATDLSSELAYRSNINNYNPYAPKKSTAQTKKHNSRND